MKSKKILFIPLFAFVLSGCRFTDYLTKLITDLIPTEEKKEDNPVSGDSDTNKEHERYNPENGDGYTLINPEDVPYTNKDVWDSIGSTTLGSTGDQSILVVPVEIKNSSRIWNSFSLQKLNRVFFGQASQTSWESVTSFYETSSYGKVHIKGEVAPVFKTSRSLVELKSYVEGGEHWPDKLVWNEFSLDDSYNELKKKYDTDSDGYIDAVAFVYNAPIDYDSGFWAWVNWTENDPNVESPTLNAYMWVSMDFVDGSKGAYGSDGIDGHTIIHESGHLFGLNDYYASDKNVIDASGCCEMHANNIGDENIYTKYLLGWSNPYYVKTSGKVTLTLRSSALYGDAILINDYWNSTPFDEYLILEFYTNDGNNKKDSNEYYTNGLKMFTKPGIRMYHIDSRLVNLTPTGDFKKYATPETKEELNKDLYFIGANNNPSSSYLPLLTRSKIRQVQLIDAKNREHFSNENVGAKSDGHADENTLFKKGSSYVPSETFFKNGGKFNNGHEVGYKINIDDVTSSYATVTIEKI